MLKVYGTPTCPDCKKAKENFDYYNIPYEYIDVCENVKTLKEFILFRDSNPRFDKSKEKGLIGIPAIIKEDGTITFRWQEVVKEKGFEPIDDFKSSCSIDGKGC